MPTNHERDSRGSNAEQRRWLIGVGISVVFGLFGAVMAWLSYSAKTRAQQAAPAQTVPTNNADHADRGKRRPHPGKD